MYQFDRYLKSKSKFLHFFYSRTISGRLGCASVDASSGVWHIEERCMYSEVSYYLNAYFHLISKSHDEPYQLHWILLKSDSK